MCLTLENCKSCEPLLRRLRRQLKKCGNYKCRELKYKSHIFKRTHTIIQLDEFSQVIHLSSCSAPSICGSAWRIRNHNAWHATKSRLCWKQRLKCCRKTKNTQWCVCVCVCFCKEKHANAILTEIQGFQIQWKVACRRVWYMQRYSCLL